MQTPQASGGQYLGRMDQSSGGDSLTYSYHSSDCTVPRCRDSDIRVDS